MFNSPLQGDNKTMTNFQEGDRIMCIKRPDSGNNGNFGREGVVTDVDDGVVYVEYDNGNTGNSDKPELYYKKIVTAGHRARDGKYVSSTSHREPKTFMDGITAAIRRATMGQPNKNLVKAGLMTEDGLFTESAVAYLAQQACAADVALGANSALVTAANAIIADRKENKED